MAHILLIKRSKADGKLYALCHRRGRPIREAYHWGIPGGAFDREERHLLQSSEVDREIKLQVCRRAAIREAIEESGGGEHELLPPQPIVGVGAVMDGHTHTIYLKEVEFRDVTIPPGLLNITDNTDNTRLMSARYGSAKDKKTNVFVYVLDPHLDAAYFSNWSPRALLPYRKEIDEDYVKANCKYGQLWIDLDRILQHPTRPVESSSNPLCEFLVNLFSDMPEELLQHIADLEECQRARFIAQPLQLRVAENSDQMILVTPTAKS